MTRPGNQLNERNVTLQLANGSYVTGSHTLYQDANGIYILISGRKHYIK